MTVKLGLERPIEWAGSSKRRYARVWSVVRAGVDDTPGSVQWMPAHTSESAIGQATGSDGTHISHDMWCSNQLCDALAKQSAETVRIPDSDRGQFLRKRDHVAEMLIYLGQVTFAANALLFSDGVVRRDSTAVKSYRVRRGKASNSKTSATVLPKVRQGPAKQHLSAGIRRRSKFGGVGKRPTIKRGSARAIRDIEARREADLQHWWRESRSHVLKPACQHAPSAKERLEAL